MVRKSQEIIKSQEISRKWTKVMKSQVKMFFFLEKVRKRTRKNLKEISDFLRSSLQNFL